MSFWCSPIHDAKQFKVYSIQKEIKCSRLRELN